MTKLVYIDPATVVFQAKKPENKRPKSPLAMTLFKKSNRIFSNLGYENLNGSNSMLYAQLEESKPLPGYLKELLEGVTDYKRAKITFLKEIELCDIETVLLNFKYKYDQDIGKLLVHPELLGDHTNAHDFFSRKDTVIYYDQDSEDLYYRSCEKSSEDLDLYVPYSLDGEKCILQHTNGRSIEILLTLFSSKIRELLGESEEINPMLCKPVKLGGQLALEADYYRRAYGCDLRGGIEDLSADALAQELAVSFLLSDTDRMLHNYLIDPFTGLIHPIDFGGTLEKELRDLGEPSLESTYWYEESEPPIAKKRDCFTAEDIMGQVKEYISPFIKDDNQESTFLQQDGCCFSINEGASSGASNEDVSGRSADAAYGIGLGSQDERKIHNFIFKFLTSLDRQRSRLSNQLDGIYKGLLSGLTDEEQSKLLIITTVLRERLGKIEEFLKSNETLIAAFDFIDSVKSKPPEMKEHAKKIHKQAKKAIRLWRRRELFANFVCNKRFPDPMQKLLVAQFSALEFSDIRVDSKVAALIGKILPVFKSEKKDEITEIDAMCGHSEKTLQELESFAQNVVAASSGAEVGRNAFFPVINDENPGKNTCKPKPLSPTSITDNVN